MRVLSLTEGLDEQNRAARGKLLAARSPARYLVSSMLAGAYIGIGVVLMLTTAGPFHAAQSPAERLVAGAVFAVALTLVVFAGAELSTSAMMILTQGALTRSVPAGPAAGVLIFCFAGNLVGSLIFGWAVVRTGILHSNKGAGIMLADMLAAKAHETSTELFFRGVLCNVLVCVAIWACARLRSESGKAIVIFWAIFAFISSGFEHVVANMTTFGMGLFSADGLTTWAIFGRNMLWVGLGNLVGGGLVVGAAYVVITGRLGAPHTADVSPEPVSAARSRQD